MRRRPSAGCRVCPPTAEPSLSIRHVPVRIGALQEVMTPRAIARRIVRMSAMARVAMAAATTEVFQTSHKSVSSNRFFVCMKWSVRNRPLQPAEAASQPQRTQWQPVAVGGYPRVADSGSRRRSGHGGFRDRFQPEAVIRQGQHQAESSRLSTPPAA